MNWNKLLSNKCPKCGKELDFKSDFEYMLCDISCGFQISVQRMKEICGSKATYRVEGNNQERLNNLGCPQDEENEDLQDFSHIL